MNLTDSTWPISLNLTIYILANSVPFAESFRKSGISWHEYHEECRALKIKCQRNNEWLGRVHFTFMDGVSK